MSIRQLIQSLPDIVRDSRLDTEIFAAYTQHIVYVSGSSARERHVPKKERWVRDQFLGQGAYGTVHLERCERNDGTTKLRAVKQIKKYNVAGKELEYMRELEAISKFSHNRYSHCFVRSDGWFENDESVFITMEYLEKGDLHKYLTKPLPELEARAITSQVLEGLKFMHENGFVHRDLKPGNIMVVTTGPEWFVKIADFGISKRRQQDVTSMHTLQMGTLGFAAPETMGFGLGSESRSYTAAVDLWSLGVCVYMMLLNDLPFPNIAELFRYANGILSFPSRSLQSHSVTDQGQQFIAALMSPDPMDRPSSEMADKHPWITTSFPVQLADIKHGDTMLSAASATWSSISEPIVEQPEKLVEADTKKLIEEPIENKTVVLLEEPEETIPSLHYRPPYVDSCDDEQEETNREPLPPGSPYVLDDADSSNTSLPIISEDLESHTPITPSSDLDGKHITKPLEKLLTLPTGISDELFTPNLVSRPRSPYFVQTRQKMDLSHILKHGRSKSTTENEHKFVSDHTDDLRPQSPITVVPPGGNIEDTTKKPVNERPDRSRITDKNKVDDTISNGGNEEDDNIPNDDSQSLVLFTGVKSDKKKVAAKIDPEAYQRGLLFAKGTTYIPCAYCESQYHVFGGEIRLVPCGHWICHYCLMERFALYLVLPEFELQCCDKDITRSSFNRILVDPKINRAYDKRNGRKHRPTKQFIAFLDTKGVLRNPSIRADIKAITGLVLSEEQDWYPSPDESHPPPKRKRSTKPKRTYYNDTSEYWDSDPDPPMVQDDEQHLAGYKHGEADVITHRAGQPGRLSREGASYTDIYSWRDQIPVQPTRPPTLKKTYHYVRA
ncbi:kinase-like domain-containing protein [Annulohypoxylon maeteangense]|uniref:kinase-like domain-containing protein n=1 Tax=Annulohypoxylon maeteangense TaxID=1927788 RepID=UPI0020077ADA|nr:kinase-like domain-containing protein [Annulohypoxylon maeteangense]KAI0890143.1 kinase-like domain-containing protein [Annulohypoxylon maeteangense]